MIHLDQVDKVYRTDRIETLAISGMSLKVEKGEFVSVMGPSGSGKSTLLNIMGLLDSPSDGCLKINEIDVGRLGDRALARMRNEMVGFVFQSFHLIRDLSVIDNVEIPLLYRKMSAKERRRRSLDALERVGLTSRVRHRPSQLSGGQQQRVAIARAVVGEPKILLADEPTGNLDSKMGQDIMSILFSLNKDFDTTIVMVTHDVALAEETGRTIRLFDGRQVN